MPPIKAIRWSVAPGLFMWRAQANGVRVTWYTDTDVVAEARPVLTEHVRGVELVDGQTGVVLARAVDVH